MALHRGPILIQCHLITKGPPMETPLTNTARVAAGMIILPEPQPGIVTPPANPDEPTDIIEEELPTL